MSLVLVLRLALSIRIVGIIDVESAMGTKRFNILVARIRTLNTGNAL